MQQKTINPTEFVTKTRSKIFVRIAVFLAIATVCGAATFVYFNNESKNKQGHGRRNLITVKRGPAEISVLATGIIRPIREVKISPKQSGLLKKLFVKQGDRVKAGQIIALMDDSNLRGQVESARGAYLASLSTFKKMQTGNRPQEVAQARFQELKSQKAVRQAKGNINRLDAQIEALRAQLSRDESFAKRQSLLSSAGAVSEQAKMDAETAAKVTRSQLMAAEREQDQAEEAEAQAEAELQAVREQYSLMQAGFRAEEIETARHNTLQTKGQLTYSESLLNDMTIRAPFDGIITQKYTDAGAIVTPTTSAATTSATSSSIVALSGKLEMVAQVAESNVPKITIGQPVEITATAYPDRTFKGKVTQIAPAAIVTQNVTTFEVHADLVDNSNYELLSGMNVSAKFRVGMLENAITIPTICVVSKKGQTGVYVPGEEDKSEPEFIPVKTGPTVGKEIVIVEGLKEGDQIFRGLSKEQLAKEGYDGRRPGGGGFMGGGGRGMGRGLR